MFYCTNPYFKQIDEIEDTLLKSAPERFRKAFSPSNLLKVHYVCDEGELVRLDIYNTTMHSMGEGTREGFSVERILQPRCFPEISPFECPVLSLEVLMDMKFVAFLERGQRKDLEGIFFGLWTAELKQPPGLPWYKKSIACHGDRVSNVLDGHLLELLQTRPDLDLPRCTYTGNMSLVRSAEMGGPKSGLGQNSASEAHRLSGSRREK